MLPSLELNWLRNLDKTLLLPTVIFVSGTEHSVEGEIHRGAGLYFHPRDWEPEINGIYYDGRRGLILATTDEPECIPAVLAHEWRHHWQFHHGLLPTDNIAPWTHDGNPDTYSHAIKQFFQQNAYELDALRFEMSRAPNWANEYQADLVFGGDRRES